MLKLWIIGALCCCLAGCGARSAMLSDDDASAGDAAVTPDAPQGCVHPPITKQCQGGWCTIPAGCFTMGSPTTEPCREPLDNAAYGKETPHEVTLTHDFAIQRNEVTVGEFEVAMGWKPGHYLPCGKDCPAVDLRWGVAAAYCNALSAKQGLATCYVCSLAKYKTTCSVTPAYKGKAIYSCPGYRLPTEAEWEYAYRAGTASAYYSGPVASTSCADCVTDPNLEAIGWYCGNVKKSYYHYEKVGTKAPNGWGMHDMAGNAWEWCHDEFVANLGPGKQVDPVSGAAGVYHVYRGGGSSYPAKLARAAARGKSNSSGGVGVRCVRSLLP